MYFPHFLRKLRLNKEPVGARTNCWSYKELGLGSEVRSNHENGSTTKSDHHPFSADGAHVILMVMMMVKVWPQAWKPTV